MNKLTNKVLTQISELLDRVCVEGQLTIGLLRYGAHLPHLWRHPREVDLLLSHMMDFMPTTFFHGKRVLLLDDTVYRGRELSRVTDHLVRDCGVHRNDVQTATVGVHAQAQVDDRHRFVARYDDARYIEWKEELARIVQRTLRPTDRDHPLYYYALHGVSLAELVTILRRAGPLYSVGFDASGATIRLSVPLPRLLEDPRLRIAGFTLQSIPKIRLYCRPHGADIDVTCVPMLFGRVALEDFLRAGAEELSSHLHLDPMFFQGVWRADVRDRERMLFFFATRGLAALGLRIFLEDDVVPFLADGAIKTVSPVERDKHVKYVFPSEYLEFHSRVFTMLETAISHTARRDAEANAQETLFGMDSASGGRASLEADEFAPRVLAYVAERCDPAEWNGSAWEPRPDDDACVEYSDLTTAMNDRFLLSRVLDELLDSGLLRARDGRVENTNATYSRTYRCGGEYKAVEVARIRDTFMFGDTDAFRSLAEEERRALWGSDVS